MFSVMEYKSLILIGTDQNTRRVFTHSNKCCNSPIVNSLKYSPKKRSVDFNFESVTVLFKVSSHYFFYTNT